MTRRLMVVAVVGMVALGGCTRTVTRTEAVTSPQGEICSGLSELDATFAAVPAITSKTTPEEVKKLRDDIERASEKVTSQRGRFNETARTDLAGARQSFLMVVDHSGSSTAAVGSASARMKEAYQAVKGSTNAVRYSTHCPTKAS